MQLTSGANFDQHPDVTPDGKWVVYTTWPSAIAAIWKVPLTGGVPQQVSTLQSFNPVVSPDGKDIVCQVREAYDGLMRIAILSLSNGNIVKDFPDIPISEDLPVRWSPDGKSLDFVDSNGRRIMRKPIHGGVARPLTQASSDAISDFSWSPDGSKLAMLTVRSESDVIFLHRKR